MDRPKRLVKEASSWCEVLWGREPRNDQACWPRGRDKPTLEIRQLCTRLREVSRLEVVPQPCQWDSSCPWEAVHRNWQQLRWQSGWIDLRADELHSIHVTNDGCVLAELLQMILVESRGLVLMGLFELILLMASLSLSWTSSRMNLSLSWLCWIRVKEDVIGQNLRNEHFSTSQHCEMRSTIRGGYALQMLLLSQGRSYHKDLP